jgi:hypothetical protein
MGIKELSNFVTANGMIKDKNNTRNIFFHPFNEACIKSDETDLERLNHRQHFSACNIMPLQHGSLTRQHKETIIESIRFPSHYHCHHHQPHSLHHPHH